jgi:hypothetical protein
VLEWLLQQVDRTLDDVKNVDASPRSRLASELEVLFYSADVNRKLYIVLFDYVAMGTRSDRFHALLAAFFQACRRRDIAIVEDGIRQQQFRRANPEVAAAIIRALVDGCCLQWLFGTDATPIEVYRDHCRAFLGSYLLP